MCDLSSGCKITHFVPKFDLLKEESAVKSTAQILVNFYKRSNRKNPDWKCHKLAWFVQPRTGRLYSR